MARDVRGLIRLLCAGIKIFYVGQGSVLFLRNDFLNVTDFIAGVMIVNLKVTFYYQPRNFYPRISYDVDAKKFLLYEL